jgi:Tol biopolymer transport system component
MGEVYRAHDPRLGRDVAIKVCAERFNERFEREARAVAALNHPNICQLYDIGPDYLVMELIEGDAPKGPMPVDEALGYARQIASALEAAHEKGIVHRDLKPANLKIKPDGTVKVLDFGLAKNIEAASGDPQTSPTLTLSMTRAGMIMGTAAYMSPEQARGRNVDKRADIWAFGVVLYEMLTGRVLFAAEDLTSTLAAVVKDTPDLTAVPAEVRPLLERCLEKEPRKRLRDIGDIDLLLGAAASAPPSAPGKSRPGVFALMLALIGAAVFALLAAAIAFVHFREKPPEIAPLRLSLLPPENTTFDFTNGVGLPAISPDGTRIVFGARTADGKNPLWVRPLDSTVAQQLVGTERAAFPFWSPDSRYIAFYADGKLKKIDASGGPAITLADAPNGRGGSWSPAGIILFNPDARVNGTPMQRISASGGTPVPVTGVLGRLPWFLPDGHHFLYQDNRSDPGRKDFAITIRVASLDGGEPKALLNADSNAVYAQGHLLFVRAGNLLAQPFDLKRLVMTGEAIPISEGVQCVLNTRTAGVFSVTETGLLAFRLGEGEVSVLTWFDRDGNRGAALGEPARIAGRFQFSADQKSLAASIVSDTGWDIWTYDLARGLRSRLAFGDTVRDSPVWSPDGRSIAYSGRVKQYYDLYRIPANGTGEEERLYADDHTKSAASWSPDGRFLLYTLYTGSQMNLWALPLTPNPPGSQRRPFPVVQSSFNAVSAQFSPDGHWIVYASNESGRMEVYATAFPPGAGGKRQISSAGGGMPRWRQDGKEILYAAPDRQIMAAEIAIRGEALEVGKVRALFLSPGGTANFEVTADGQRFLFAIPVNDKASEPLTLIQNWTATLK